jgi:hypothetical protein
MINIKEIKYEINPVEINAYPDEYDWSHSDCKACKAWLALSELNSVPSLFIEFDSMKMAIGIQDLQTLLALPIVQKLLDEQSK